jgi:oxygen-independent coproporphyrinogen-3 oxidase
MTDLASLTALIRKYDRPGPRYTSYPTAPHFRADIPAEDLRAGLRRDASRDPVSLYVHIPFCDSSCWFCGCHSVVTRDKARADRYIDALEREIDRRATDFGATRPAAQTHWGGGSPSFLTPERITRLARAISARFPAQPDCEAGVEIDPRDLTHEQAVALAAAGFNRASIGIQDTDERVQRAVNRLQPREVNERAAGDLRAAGFRSLNVDLMYGLPLQTPEGFLRTIEDALALRPDRIAVFGFAHVPWMKPVQKIIRPETLPDADARIRLLLVAIERLEAAGFVHIGMDHFARPDDELAVAQRRGELKRNFQGYSTRAGLDLHGLGASAISQTAGWYVQNVRELAVYERTLADGKPAFARGLELTAEDRIRREIIMRIMCDFRLDYAAFSEAHAITFEEAFAAEIARLEPLEGDGLLIRRAGGFEVTSVGRLLVRNIAMVFDARLEVGTGARYSRTV